MMSLVTADGSSNEAVLTAFRIGPDALLGRGGEASIYALDDDRVLRLLHPHGDIDQLCRNQALLGDLVASAVSFRLPEILEIGEIQGRTYAIERRLPGSSVLELLGTTEGIERDRLVEAYLEAASTLGDLHSDGWGYFGELATAQPLRAPTWRDFLAQRAARSLATAGHPLDEIDAAGFAADLPEPTRAEFVHLDAFAGNMLADGTAITAVLDIGYACVAGDRRFSSLAAAVYLEPWPEVAPFTRFRDREVARSWLRSAGLSDVYEPARRWLAAYWAFAVDDAALQAWCRSVLLPWA